MPKTGSQFEGFGRSLMERMYRSIQPKNPGATPLNLTGTVQEVWDQINNLPGYQAPQK